MAKFNPWEMHHFYVGLVSMTIGAVLLFAWYFGDRSPWHGGYGVVLFVFGAWMCIDDLYQHWRQMCGFLPEDMDYHSWVHRRYNADCERYHKLGACVLYLGTLGIAGLAATGVFWKI